MNVIAINGSARIGGNTETLINTVFDALKDADIECELVQLARADIHGCRACWGCDGTRNCIHHDDAFCEVFEKMKAADGILLASPVYTGNISTALQAVLERAAVVCDMNREAALLSRKIGACLAVARRGGALNTFDTLANFFLLQDMYVVGSSYWPIAYGQMPGDVAHDEEGLTTARKLAENMQHLLRACDHHMGA
ncbi:flavodoxin family protein [Adlercreutzia murintestinalis]|uniref:flavodoxin family protein n=1 Tax=Adlercreutzia murintestinalis TaxID=2941325 RepID=UPI003D81069E